MIVVDSSAWIEYFRSTGSPIHRMVRRLIAATSDIAVTDVVVAELLAGAPDEGAAEALRARLNAFPVLALDGLADFEAAAGLFRACRKGGETVRELTDCLIAIPTIRMSATLLAADRDFEVLARHTPLRLEPVDA